MSQPPPLSPTYAGAFQCIGPECEDHCCGDWNIPLDQATYNAYQAFPPGKLRETVQQFVFPNTPDAPAGMVANIYRNSAGLCPFLGADRLCQIQHAYGPRMLSATCSIYPRALSVVGRELEGSLSMSCPEAARQVLLDPDFLTRRADLNAGGFRTDNVFYPAAGHAVLHPVRDLLIRIVRDRTRSLAHRLLLIGAFAQKLDQAGTDDTILTLIDAYHRVMEEGTMRAEFAAMPGSDALRLEVVLALTSQCVADPDCSPRFRDTYWTFIEGIGSSAQTAPGDDLARFRQAAETIYRPFMAGSPFLLENYLINYILQHLFPFGRTGSTQFETRSCSAEWLLLALQFAWLETLLIGVAAARRQSLSTADIIRTVQTFTRATEHDPEVLIHALAQIAARNLNTPEGVAALLRYGD